MFINTHFETFTNILFFYSILQNGKHNKEADKQQTSNNLRKMHCIDLLWEFSSSLQDINSLRPISSIFMFLAVLSFVFSYLLLQ